MAKLSYAPQALNDLERLTDFLMATDPTATGKTLELIAEAVSLLTRHPLIGQPVKSGLRELVISRGRSGYAALYSVEDAYGAVLILSIRHQLEAGYGSYEV